jgi:hypothetical protein
MGGNITDLIIPVQNTGSIFFDIAVPLLTTTLFGQ